MANRINSRAELITFREELKKNAESSKFKTVIAVGMGTCGAAAGASEVFEAIKDELAKANRSHNVSLISVGCYGFCFAEPMVEVRQEGKPVVRYGYADEKVARAIVREHIENGEVLKSNVLSQEVRTA